MAEIAEAIAGTALDPYAHTSRIADRLAAFKTKDFVSLPIFNDLVQQMDLLRLTSSRMPVGEPRDGMCIALCSGVGKTTAAKMLVKSAARRASVDDKQSPVLLVTLDVEETISLWSAILRSLGDPYWNTGYPKNLKDRALKLMAQRGVELIIIDEFNHSVDRGQARQLMNTVKEILNGGRYPVIVMGTDEEVERLPAMPAFERRMVHAREIGPLKYDEDNWCRFLKGLDRTIVTLDILPRKSGLGSPKLAQALHEACGGVIGYAHWVVQDALTEVLQRNGTDIGTADLAISVGRLFLKFKLYRRVNAVERLA